MVNQNSKSVISPIVAAVAGAVVGAGVAVAGAMVLKNKKNREKVGKVLENAKKQVVDYVENMTEQAENTKNEIEEKIVDGQSKAKKVSKIVKKSLANTVKDVKKAVK